MAVVSALSSPVRPTKSEKDTIALPFVEEMTRNADIEYTSRKHGLFVNMEYRPLEITLISAKDLKDVNLVFRMDVYAVVTINGDPQTKQKTPVDKKCGSNPEWNYTMKFTVEETAANQNRLNLVIRLVSDRLLGDKDIGEVLVPIKEFLDCKEEVFVYNVSLPNGKVKGTLNLCCKIGEKFSVPVAAPPHVTEKGKSAETPVMAYPAAGSSAGPPPAAHPYNYPPQGAYPPPSPHGCGGYLPLPAQGYGGYGYIPVQQPPAGSGRRLAGGLLARLFIGEMVSNASSGAGLMDGGAGFMDWLTGGFHF